MEKKKKFGTGAIIGIVVLALLTALSIVADILVSLVLYPDSVGWSSVVEVVTFLLLLGAVIYYFVQNYRKSHGNLLRWTYFFFSLNCVGIMVEEIVGAFNYGLMETKMGEVMLLVILIAISAVLAAFMSGRLDHLRGNVACIVIITAAQLIKSIIFLYHYYPVTGIFEIITSFSTFVLWIDMIAAYIIRYKEHKEAGLTDKN